MTSVRRLRGLLVILLVAIAALGVAVPSSGAASPSWVPENPANKPAGRAFASMAYDPANNQVVAFGGYLAADAHPYLGDTWTWDGVNWLLRAVPGPPARAYAGMAYAGNGRVLLYGGFDGARQLDDTWLWDGSGSGRWTPVEGPGPGARQNVAMAYDEARKTVVLFGGAQASTHFGDTWLWNGTAWTERRPARAPAPQAEPVAAYHAGSRKVVLVHRPLSGGVLETWTWDGSDWAPESPSLSPPDRMSASIGYDARNDQIVMFGGSIDTPAECGGNDGFNAPLRSANDTWTWDGEVWIARNAQNSPSPRHGATMAQNPSARAERSVVLFGGSDGGAFHDDTWVWDLGVSPESTTTSSTTTTAGSSTTTTPPTTTSTVPPPRPVVLGVDPNTGTTEGGEKVQVRGLNFLGATHVCFGPSAQHALLCPSASCAVRNETEVEVTTPAHDAGTVPVVVVGPHASSPLDGAGLFTYLSPGGPVSDPDHRSDTGAGEGPTEQPLQPAPPGGSPAGGAETSAGLDTAAVAGQSDGLQVGGSPQQLNGWAVGSGSGGGGFLPASASPPSGTRPVVFVTPQPPPDAVTTGQAGAAPGSGARGGSDPAVGYTMVRGEAKLMGPAGAAATAGATFLCIGVAAFRRRQPRPRPQPAY